MPLWEKTNKDHYTIVPAPLGFEAPTRATETSCTWDSCAEVLFSKACSIEIDHETVLFGLVPEGPQRGMAWGSIGINHVIRSVLARSGGKRKPSAMRHTRGATAIWKELGWQFSWLVAEAADSTEARWLLNSAYAKGKWSRRAEEVIVAHLTLIVKRAKSAFLKHDYN